MTTPNPTTPTTMEQMTEAAALSLLENVSPGEFARMEERLRGRYTRLGRGALAAAGVPALLADRDALAARVRVLEGAVNEVFASYRLDGNGEPPTHGRPSIADAWKRLRSLAPTPSDHPASPGPVVGGEGDAARDDPRCPCGVAMLSYPLNAAAVAFWRCPKCGRVQTATPSPGAV